MLTCALVYFRSWLTSRWPSVREWWTVRSHYIWSRWYITDRKKMMQCAHFTLPVCWNNPKWCEIWAAHMLIYGHVCLQMFWGPLILLLQMSVWCSAPAVKRRAAWSFRWSVCERPEHSFILVIVRFIIMALSHVVNLNTFGRLWLSICCVSSFIYKPWVSLICMIINCPTQSDCVQGTADPERALVVAKLVWVCVFLPPVVFLKQQLILIKLMFNACVSSWTGKMMWQLLMWIWAVPKNTLQRYTSGCWQSVKSYLKLEINNVFLNLNTRVALL